MTAISVRPRDATPSLLPPQATDFERDLEQATARLCEVPVPEGDIWHADRCPVTLLGWLAWAVSADSWDPAWPESVKRATIKMAPLMHRRKGTLWAVQSAIQPLGTDTHLTEWWATSPPGQPGTFTATTLLNRPGGTAADPPLLSPALLGKLRSQISQAKPISRTVGMRVGLTVTVRERSAAALRPAQVSQIEFREKTEHQGRAGHREFNILRPATRINIQMEATP